MKFILLTIFCCSVMLASIAQNVGLGTTTPTEKLHVDSGNVKIGNAVWFTAADDKLLKFGDLDFVSIGEADGDDYMRLTARKFTFTHAGGYNTPFVEIQGPLMIADGSQGNLKILTSDSDGNASWQAPSNAASAFNANVSVAVPVASGTPQLLSWDIEKYDEGSDLVGSTFTTTKPGLYHFDVTLTFSLSGIATSGAFVGITANLPAGKTKLAFTPVSASDNGGKASVVLSMDVKLASGETISIAAFQNTGSSQNVIAEIAAGSEVTSFSGHRVY